MKVGKIDDCLKKRLIAINNLYIYGNRFANLTKYNIHEKEIINCKPVDTKNVIEEVNFLKNEQRNLN